MKKSIQISDIILANHEGKMLMQLRDDKNGIYGPGKWGLIGGGKNKIESSIKCAIREIREELGIKLKELELIDIVEDEDDDTHFKHHIFFGEIKEYPSGIKLYEGEKIGFFNTKEIGNILTVPWFSRIYSNSIKKLKKLNKIY